MQHRIAGGSMLFNSYIFLFLFFPCCLLGYYLLKNRNATAAKVWLILFSLWFYGYFNIRYLGIMIFSILFNYGIHRLMCKEKKYAKGILAVGVAANLCVLFYFKYFDFFVENINAVFHTSIALRHILLPLGISFFTFQQISFLADTYREEIKDCGFVDYSLFVTFFPQLIAGPIVTHEEMLPQFEKIGTVKWDEEKFSRGLFIFILGMCKKVLIADTFGMAVDTGYSMVEGLGSIDALLVMLFYTLQLYFDFSGYCDMAIGIGQMLCIDLPINFNSPYKAGNIIEFWKRWHITLSRFFTRNIYIPLGGNRKGNVRMYCNLFLIFFLSGLWHGAGWTFVLWGVMHGVLYCITRACKRLLPTFKIPRILSIFLTFLYVNVAWVFFRAESIGQAITLLKQIFCGGIRIPAEAIANAFNLDEFWYVMKIAHLTDFTYSKYILMILFTVVILIAVFFGKNVQELAKKWKPTVWNALITAFLFLWCVVSLSGVSTFLYFNF